MNVAYESDLVTLFHGDALEALGMLPRATVHCCVTSPPYWGLRDYGVASQIGLEPTPEEWVEKMVAVFRAVRRALREDGTLWLNLGSSYFSGQRAGSHGTSGRGSRDYRDDDCPSIHLCDACQDSLANRIERIGNRLVLLSAAYEGGPILDHKGSPFPSLESLDSFLRLGPGRSDHAKPDRQPASAPADELPPAALMSTIDESWPPPLGACFHCANCGICLSVLRSSSRDAQECVRMGGRLCTFDISRPLLPWDARIKDTVFSSWAWGYSTTEYLKIKDDCGIPWMLAFALRADGWWLRSDIIWSKPNPMPESVKDRPTKSHEYLFLLTKSEQYYYNADAIREPEVYGDHPRTVRGLHKASNTPGQPPHTGLRPGYKMPDGWATYKGGHGSFHKEGREKGKKAGISKPDYDDRKWRDRSDGVSRPPMTMKDREYNPAGRNKRTVWTIPTQPMPEAHFATFPEKLVEPCVLAGSPAAGTVLDPFCGSGTTGVVAVRHERKFLGIDLNRQYLEEIAGPRIAREERKDRQPSLFEEHDHDGR